LFYTNLVLRGVLVLVLVLGFFCPGLHQIHLTKLFYCSKRGRHTVHETLSQSLLLALYLAFPGSRAHLMLPETVGLICGMVEGWVGGRVHWRRWRLQEWFRFVWKNVFFFFFSFLFFSL
jgi:hypothetical protein